MVAALPVARPLFFPFVGKNGQVNIAWHCCSGSRQISGDNLEWLLVLSKGLLIGVNLFIYYQFDPRVHKRLIAQRR